MNPDENPDLQWGPHFTYNIYSQSYEDDFCKTMSRITDPDNDTTQFIKRKGLDYFTITLLTNNPKEALTLHVRRCDLYICGISVGKGAIYAFTDLKKDFTEKTVVDMKFGGNYNYLTRDLGLKAYQICFLKFRKSVERLISSLLADKKNPHDWIEDLFTVCVVIAEGARNNIIRYGVGQSQESSIPSKINKLWVKLLINNWSKISQVASRYEGGEVLVSHLTEAELDRLLAINVKDGDLGRHFEQILLDQRLARAMLAILWHA